MPTDPPDSPESEMTVLQRVLATPDIIPPPRTEGGCMHYRPTWREKIGMLLFPAGSHLDWPELEGSKDGHLTRVRCELSFLDRLRVFLTGRCTVEIKVKTLNFLGEHRAASHFKVDPPKFLSLE